MIAAHLEFERIRRDLAGRGFPFGGFGLLWLVVTIIWIGALVR